MSYDACLALRMCAPLQSWGVDSRFNRRNTATMPSRSAVAGILCASLGLGRGTCEESAFLAEFSSVRMVTVNAQRAKTARPSVEDAFWDSAAGNDDGPSAQPLFQMRRMQDYHTVLGTASAEGGALPHAVLTYRQYLTDAMFFVFLCGKGELMERLGGAVRDPVWGLWLGRKSCIPSAPMYAGVYPGLKEAEAALLNGLCVTAREEDCGVFSEGTDTIPDIPLDFCSEARKFGLRRVLRTYRGKTGEVRSPVLPQG